MLLPKPKITVTVIVPTLNESKTIGPVLASVRSVLPTAQLLVVDGGSKDSTAKIAKKYATVLHNPGRTIASARNEGVHRAKGDLLIFLDADTLLTKQFVSRAFSELSDPRTVVAGGLVMPRDVGPFTTLVFYFFNFLIFASFAIGKPVLAGTCVAYKKKAFDAVGGFDEEMAASEDFDLCERVSRLGRAAFLSDVVVYTSNRRIKGLGLVGLLKEWGGVTLNYYLGKKTRHYGSHR